MGDIEKARVVGGEGWDGVGRKGMLDRGSKGFEWWEDRLLRNVDHSESRLDKGLLSE